MSHISSTIKLQVSQFSNLWIHAFKNSNCHQIGRALKSPKIWRISFNYCRNTQFIKFNMPSGSCASDLVYSDRAHRCFLQGPQLWYWLTCVVLEALCLKVMLP